MAKSKKKVEEQVKTVEAEVVEEVDVGSAYNIQASVTFSSKVYGPREVEDSELRALFDRYFTALNIITQGAFTIVGAPTFTKIPLK